MFVKKRTVHPIHTKHLNKRIVFLGLGVRRVGG